ncbi:hypothetical protein Nepgr_015732 [Nepenthes gracilis]|uniref:Uncharacterized protein n=1 Tax=Nepenthes gracilis TaxID=150966 RepID=A0AAD3XRK2_NEPGR|nr:hypothetical protein Nepgr_015732 [Nepenthes gracilis]
MARTDVSYHPRPKEGLSDDSPSEASSTKGISYSANVGVEIGGPLVASSTSNGTNSCSEEPAPVNIATAVAILSDLRMQVPPGTLILFNATSSSPLEEDPSDSDEFLQESPEKVLEEREHRLFSFSLRWLD